MITLRNTLLCMLLDGRCGILLDCYQADTASAINDIWALDSV